MTISITINCPAKQTEAETAHAFREIAETIAENVHNDETGGNIVHGSGTTCQWKAFDHNEPAVNSTQN